ncbi:MAG: hypothetical protein ACFKPT_19705 [Gloeotrichia echinulata GP01]
MANLVLAGGARLTHSILFRAWGIGNGRSRSPELMLQLCYLSGRG